ncbi:MAG: aromatic amino acid hydroxylase [Proteobacteria bacterium]|nr:aromatic amino acid hydroxylase [Pseudomonadota bacterium]
MTQRSVNSLPPYLRRYCAEQDYNNYTSRDHDSWRFIMRLSKAFFENHAVEIYLDGLQKTGIPTDRIPRISEMDQALQEFGWGAVPVCGFIPPIAFLDLQARKILPIATDMRSIDHIAYTPAPDIVHEAAGHAPIIADAQYREYLTQYASVAQKTIMSREDLNLYESIRILSDLKESPDASQQQIIEAQLKLDQCSRNMSFVSEATKVARMAWWTVEYGLVGPISKPKIYGAGLLSSIQESQNCLNSNVKKIPLSIKCIETSYDITEPQPQLFVANDMVHLTEVLKELEDKLCFRLGGVFALEECRKADTVNTVVLDTGLQISGKLTRYEACVNKADGDPHFLAFDGPVQLSLRNVELEAQGIEVHKSGFSTPLGRWAQFHEKPVKLITKHDLEVVGIFVGNKSTLSLVNGFKIEGQVKRIHWNKDTLIYITWTNCVVTRGSQRYFEPSWGDFDMPIGEKIVSAFGGPADRDRYGDYDMGGVSTQPGRISPFSAKELKDFELYHSVRCLRDAGKNVDSVADDLIRVFDDQWLLAIDLLEMADKNLLSSSRVLKLKKCLEHYCTQYQDAPRELIEKGLSLKN